MRNIPEGSNNWEEVPEVCDMSYIPIGACIPARMWSNVLGNYSFKASCDGGGTVQIYNSANCPSDSKVAQGTGNPVGLTVTGSPARCEEYREICGSMVRSQQAQYPEDPDCAETCDGVCLGSRGHSDGRADFNSIPYFLDACYNSTMDTSAYGTCSGGVVTYRSFNNGNCVEPVSDTGRIENTCHHEQSRQECDDNGENCVTETRTYKIDVVCQSQVTNLIQEACELELTDADWTELCESARKAVAARTEANEWSVSCSTSPCRRRRLTGGGGGGRIVTVTVASETEADKNAVKSTLDGIKITDDVNKECEENAESHKDLCGKLSSTKDGGRRVTGFSSLSTVLIVLILLMLIG